MSHTLSFSIGISWRRNAGRTAVAALLLSTALTASLTVSLTLTPQHVAAQDYEPGGDPGIDCEVPRRNGDGKIILDWDGTGRITCEADRNSALYWAQLLDKVKSHVQSEVRGFENNRLRSLGTRLHDSNGQEQVVRLLKPGGGGFPGVRNLPNELDGWEPYIGASACGTIADMQIVIWLDVHEIRDRWSPGMVQRAVRAWHARLDPRRAVYQTPLRLTEANGTPKLERVDGYQPPLDSCFQPGTLRTDAAHPADGLAAVFNIRRSVTTENRYEVCPKEGDVGRIRWERRLIDGIPVDKDDKVIASGDGWFEPHDHNICRPETDPDKPIDYTEFCSVRVTVMWNGREKVKQAHPLHRCELPPKNIRKTCLETHNGGDRFPLGERIYTRSILTTTKGRQIDDLKITDRCYRNVLKTHAQTRYLTCPAGQAGRIDDKRTVKWCDFKLAPGSKARPRDSDGKPRKNRGWKAAEIAAGNAPAAPPLCTLYTPYPSSRIGATPWQAQTSTCRPNSGNGGPDYENPGSTDTDGDGITDTVGEYGGHYGTSPDGVGSDANPGTSYGGNNGDNRP